MKYSLAFLRAFIIAQFLISACTPVSLASTRSPANTTIQGMVVAEDGASVAGATVRVKTSGKSTVTDAEGRFTLTGLRTGEPLFITAWAPGYYNSGGDTEYLPGTSDVKICLVKHSEEDHADYEWISALADNGKEGNCENCHADPNDPQATLPFTEWLADAHALSAQNNRFLTMYLGQDVNGNQSPVTRYGFNRDYGRISLRPDPSQPYYGPGYKLDFPATSGNCAACHTPAASIDTAYQTDPMQVAGVGEEGVACDFCHKVWNVRLDSDTGLPQTNMPGVLSFEFRRPPEGHQFFAGPFDDVAPGEDTYSPVQQRSQFCAPCHFGVFWDTTIYNSFGEWLASPYSNAETGRTCQDCHMPPGRSDHFARLDKGGVFRDPQTIFSHRMPGASDETLLKNAVKMDVTATADSKELVVQVTITNDQTGHHVPTDSPLRQLILLVQVTNTDGQTVDLLEGPTVPDWGGVGDPLKGYYAGLPGKGFAKILSELWTEITPTGAYWNPTRVVSDNRIAAFESDVSAYTFAMPADGRATIQVTLLFRRAFKELMDQKGWDVPDIVMAEETFLLITPSSTSAYAPEEHRDGVQRLREAHCKCRQMHGLDFITPRQIRNRLPYAIFIGSTTA